MFVQSAAIIRKNSSPTGVDSAVSDTRLFARCLKLVGSSMTYAQGEEIYGDSEEAEFVYEVVAGPEPHSARAGRYERAFARRFQQPKLIRFLGVGCTCRSVGEREGSPPCRQPARIAEILPSELVCLPHESQRASAFGPIGHCPHTRC